MTTPDLQQQITELNRKVDLLLEYVNEQRLKREVIEDLISDVSIVTKDAYKSVVTELDNRGCEIDPETIRNLLLGLLRNTKNIADALELFESLIDLLKDTAPIVKEVIIDIIHKLNEFEQKGYFQYIAEWYRILGEMYNHYTVDDLKNLSANMGSLFNIMKNLTDPEFLRSLEKTTFVLTKMKMDDTLDDKSLFKLLKELKSPEVRKSLSYTLRVIKESAK
jgi:uncharacterized protein YjgD (DUF1641 family)